MRTSDFIFPLRSWLPSEKNTVRGRLFVSSDGSLAFGFNFINLTESQNFCIEVGDKQNLFLEVLMGIYCKDQLSLKHFNL